MKREEVKETLVREIERGSNWSKREETAALSKMNPNVIPVVALFPGCTKTQLLLIFCSLKTLDMVTVTKSIS